ncbi:MAG: four helix bundle protein [Phycisphaerales bacterium JB039]
MARLSDELLERSESFSDRMLDVADALEQRHVSRRILDQISACGTSVGANAYEGDEAMTRKDFVKSLGVVVKELAESRFWLRLAGRREWISADRLAPLIDESMELRRIFGTMIVRTRAAPDRQHPSG